MSPVGPLKFKRVPEPVRRQVEVAAATAWETLVEVHAHHALRFVELMASRLAFDDAVSRYLDEMDVRDPMASSIRSRVLVALEDAPTPEEGAPPTGWSLRDVTADGEGFRRFRPDRVVKGIAQRVRASEEAEQWIALAIARAEEAVIRAHIRNAAAFAALLSDQTRLDEAVEEYIDVMKISGGRAQAVFQRTMARLADEHLPEHGEDVPDRGNGGR